VHLRILGLVLLAAALGGCAARNDGMPADAVRIAPTVTLVMPRPGDLGRSLEAVQLVTAHYGDQTFVFESHLSATPERFLLVGLDTVGRKAMTITWTDAGIDYEAAPWVPKELRPANILADIVVLYWPEASVRHALSGGTLDAGPKRRSVIAGAQEVIRAEYWPTRPGDPWSGRLHYENRAWGYTLDVESLETGR
jgi:hypothetical protein